VPEDRIELESLERRVIEKSLDLQIAFQDIRATSARLGIDVAEMRFPELHLGAEAEREPGGEWSLGPAVAVAIPIFDQGQARKAAGEAELRRLWHRFTARAVEVRATARAVRERLEGARRRAEYHRRVLVPLGRQILGETQLRYNAMQLGVFQLLEAKRREILFRTRYIEALRDYWLTRVEMIHLLAGRVTGFPARRAMGGESGGPVRGDAGNGHGS
jgi:outer membrane protein TolC